MNRAINLRFRSLAVDHFGNLASYSAIRRRKTMGKTMTSAKSRRRPLPCCVQNVSVFPLLLLRCSFFLLSRASSNRSPLGTVRIVHCCVLAGPATDCSTPFSFAIFTYSFSSALFLKLPSNTSNMSSPN